MGIDALIARLRQDAQARIAALQAAADAELALLARARADAARHRLEQALAEREAEGRRTGELERVDAQRQAAAGVLRARHALLDRVFERAEALAAASCTDPRYLASLPQQLRAVRDCLGDQPASVSCTPALAAALQPLLAALPRWILVPDAAMAPGFVVHAPDAACTIDVTLAARLAALRPRLEARLLAQAGS